MSGIPISPAYMVSSPQNGLPAGAHLYNPDQLFCTQPPAAAPSSEGFGSTFENQNAGLRGAPTTRPDVNVISISASMWW
jgi:hypothetical protein